ncbi:glycosyltransferase family 4 protein [Paenibacillus sp. TAB 01]|uniref:glycosyltransferase family 4 protein n=1 Tax=Paenibacillus sp. TAB 01 TaxID=3368988 RepID=UPI003751C7F4
MSRPKVMLFSHICGDSFITGAEKYLLVLAGELSQHFDCTLVVPAEGLLLQEAGQRGLNTIVHPIPLVWSMFKPEGSVTKELEEKISRHEHGGIVNLLHMHQPDLVITNTIVNPMPAAAAKALGIPVAWFITEKASAERDTAPAVRWIDRYADWIIGISEATLQPFRAEGLTSKLSLLPPTWRKEELHPEQWTYNRLQRRAEWGIAPEQRLVGYISSSLHPEKGLEHFIYMALKVCPAVPDVQFLIIGNTTDKDYMERCERRIQASGYTHRFHRVSFESNIEMLYPAMDFVVIPSLIEEGFGMTALEGLIFGKTVISYRAGGLDEILRTTGNASGLVEKGDVIGLAMKMLEKLTAAPSELGNQANRREAEEAFGFDTYRLRLSRLMHQFQLRCAALTAERMASPLPPLWMNAVYKSPTASAAFLIENGVKRPFRSSEAFLFYKYRWGDIHEVHDAVLHRYPTSIPVSMEAPFHSHRPSVMLAKGSGPTVYLLMEHRRFPFVSVRSIRQRGWDPERIVTIPDKELTALELGGTLTETASPSVKRARRKRKKQRPVSRRKAQVRPGKRKRKTLTRKRPAKKRLSGSKKASGRSKRKAAGRRRKAA